MDADYSIVEYMSDHSGYKCGYCKSADTNFSHGMWAHRMSVTHYQQLINRGWRRSGKYCYKPTMDKTCCPHYTIKCDALNFKPSKSQKKVLKRMHKFLSFGKTESQETKGDQNSYGEISDAQSDLQEKSCKMVEEKCLKATPPNEDNLMLLKQEPDIYGQHLVSSRLKSDSSSAVLEISSSKGSQVIKGVDPSRPLCKKAKLLRKERRETKSSMNASSSKPKPKNAEKTLEDFLNEPLPDNPAHRLEVRIVQSSPPSTEYQSMFNASHSLYVKYQSTIHKDPPEKNVVRSYKRFLCNSPLKAHKPDEGSSHGYGSYHQQYLLDGELIAVGVIDILSSSISSVYLFYDPKYSFLSLGTYSSLRELALVKELNQSYPSLKWYYMGYYIHSCSKMRYKGKYDPSYLLCPEQFTWEPIERCIPKLDMNKYSRLDEDDSNLAEEQLEYSKVLCLFDGAMVPYRSYLKAMKMAKEAEDDVKEYCNIVGPRLAYSMLLCRN